MITGYWHFRFTTLLLLIEKNLSDRVEWVSGKTYSDFVNFFIDGWFLLKDYQTSFYCNSLYNLIFFPKIINNLEDILSS